jgi:hypothetical protein
MRIVIDMNLTPRWVEHLNAAGHEAMHWSSVGPVSTKDQEICDYPARMDASFRRMISIFRGSLPIPATQVRASSSSGASPSCQKSAEP